MDEEKHSDVVYGLGEGDLDPKHGGLRKLLSGLVRRRIGERNQELVTLPFFDIRRLVQEDNVNRVLGYKSEAPASWRDFKGDYSMKSSLDGIDSVRMERSGVELSGDECLVASRISKLLEKELGRPVVALDLGGMFGMSWVKIAKFFEGEIKDGRLRMVVSNLNLDVESSQIDTSRLSKSVKQEEFSFWKDNMDLVSFINCSIDNLSEAEIAIPSGDEWETTKLGKIDLLYERMSVSAHTLIPEYDRVLIQKNLSDVGTWITDDLGHNQEKQIIEFLKKNAEAEFVGSVLAHADPGHQNAGVAAKVIYQDYLRGYDLFREMTVPNMGLISVGRLRLGKDVRSITLGRSIYRKVNSPR